MFQILPLSADRFTHLYGRSDDDLRRDGIIAQIADTRPGFPCRVSLRHAAPGERVLLLNHVHQPADTPFHASHAIYVIDGATTFDLMPGALPDVFLRPTVLSVRAFDGEGMMLTAELVDSADCDKTFTALLARDGVVSLHVHYAKYGCFAAEVVTASLPNP